MYLQKSANLSEIFKNLVYIGMSLWLSVCMPKGHGILINKSIDSVILYRSLITNLLELTFDRFNLLHFS